MNDHRIAHHYQGAEAEGYYAYQSAANQTKRLETWKFQRHIRPTDTVVDFGCGAGFLLKSLRAGTKLGVEVNSVARAEAARQGIDTVNSADEIPVGFADIVISNHALEHTVRPLDELESIRRILKAKGRLVIYTPFDDWRMHRRFHVGMDDPNHHLYTWSPLLLRNLLLEAGYEVYESRLVRFTWPPFTLQLGRLPRAFFLAAGGLASFVRQSRQVMAVASPGSMVPRDTKGQTLAGELDERQRRL